MSLAPSIKGETTTEHYTGIDVSLEGSSVCGVDAKGKTLREARVASEPEALIVWWAKARLRSFPPSIGTVPLKLVGTLTLCPTLRHSAFDSSAAPSASPPARCRRPGRLVAGCRST